MIVSVRSLLVPAVALATAGAVALSPALIAPPAATLAVPVVQIPAVHIQDIQLAGIGVDIYEAIQPYVEYAVEWAQFATAWIPGLSSQIGILYFEGLNPTVEATVFYLAGVLQNPLNFFPTTAAYLNTLVVTGYRFINAELAWLGLPFIPPLPPLPSLPFASVASTPSAAASIAKGSRTSAVVTEVPVPVGVDVAELAADVAAGVTAEVPAEVTADVAAPAPAARAARGELGRAARSAAAGATVGAGSAAAEVSEAAQQTGTEVGAAVQGAVGEVRSAARATRGAVGRAVTQARASVQAAADSASAAASDATN